MTTIAIIGTGNVGGALGTTFAKAGHTVTFAGQDAAKAATVAAAAGATAASAVVAIAAADVVILAIPGSTAPAFAAQHAAALAGKVVVDTTNPLKADYSGLATDGDSNAERIAAAAPGARVVKAFNSMFAGNMASPAALGSVLDAMYATDDEAARATFGSLANSAGFRAVYTGPLAAARELEALAWLNIRLQMVTGGAWQSAFVLVAAPEAAVAG